MFDTITAQIISNNWRIIGINGVDCSGKTTFTDSFSDYLSSVNVKNQVIHIDDFHNPRTVRDQGDYYDTVLDYGKLIREVLEPLRVNGSVDKKVICLDVDTDKYEVSRHYVIDSDTVVLIEGFLLFRPPMLDYLDGKIYLHIGFDEVLKRTAIRDVPKYGDWFIGLTKDLFIPTQKRYIKEFEPHIKCDIYVDNSDFHNPLITVPFIN
jgi:uridine kinase